MRPARIEGPRRIGAQFPGRPLNYINDIDIRPNLPVGCLAARIERDLTAVRRPGRTARGQSSKIRQLDDVLAVGIACPDFRWATAIGGKSDVPSSGEYFGQTDRASWKSILREERRDAPGLLAKCCF